MPQLRSTQRLSNGISHCTACGGSGVLRQGSDQFCTCLSCLGKGFPVAPLEQMLLHNSLKRERLSASQLSVSR
jgi:hypothetical protein